MRISLRIVVPLLGLLASGSVARADGLLPRDRPLEQAIDEYVDARLAAEKLTPAPAADDANFIRRVTLDLAGRVPTSAEVQTYLQSTEPEKKQQLVDRLLASPDFAYHQRNEIDLLLMAGRVQNEWRDWLLKAFEEQRPWPQMFREIMLSREDDAGQKAALAFLKSRAANLDDLTNDTSKAFFGVSINCAKCHDHPLVIDWTQDHYFGMASFFNRTYLTKKNFLHERPQGDLRFRPTAGDEKPAQLMFLTSAVVDEPKPAEKTDEQKKADEAQAQADNDSETPPAPPGFSRRAQLVEVALRPDPNGFFPRAFANRVWARLMGAGLVMPLDQMHSENKPSHPELLSWLARDVESSGYNLKRLIRGIVLSRAYGRSSRWEESGERPSERLFAVATVRPLTPMQFSLSLSVATSNPLELSQKQQQGDEWARWRKDAENNAFGFSQQIEIPVDNFQIGVGEALLFSNNAQIEQQYLREGGDRLTGVLKGISDREQLIRTAVLAIDSRTAESDEIGALAAYLAAREDRSLSGIQQLQWSLLTSGSFRFNY